jgi:hypothetical protein
MLFYVTHLDHTIPPHLPPHPRLVTYRSNTNRPKPPLLQRPESRRQCPSVLYEKVGAGWREGTEERPAWVQCPNRSSFAWESTRRYICGARYVRLILNTYLPDLSQDRRRLPHLSILHFMQPQDTRRFLRFAVNAESIRRALNGSGWNGTWEGCWVSVLVWTEHQTRSSVYVVPSMPLT